ncbi:MAG: hypothetical protein RJA25_916 [Bacteroidota bacterium]|jgi:hypothetical protein
MLADSTTETDRYLEKFVKQFVLISETALSTYYKNLVENIPKQGKWAELVTQIIRTTTSGGLIAVGAVGGEPAKVGTAIGLSLLEEIVSGLSGYKNREKLKKLIYILEIYQEDKEKSQSKVRKCLIEAGVAIFQSFEIQFMKVTAHNSWEFPMLKLARDATDRMVNYYRKNTLAGEFFIPSIITKAIILGKSRRYKATFLRIPNRHLGRTLDSNIKTEKIFQETPVLKIVSEHKNYCYKMTNSQPMSDFRLIFEWEEESNVAIQWGIDDEILLSGNRHYKKSTSFTETTLNNLLLAHLTKEQLEEKQLAIFEEISNKNVVLEANLKKELQNVRENIKSTVIVELNKLEESIIDLKHIMNATVENLIKLGEGQEEIRNEIENYKVRTLNLTDSIQMALEILIKIQKKQNNEELSNQDELQIPEDTPAIEHPATNSKIALGKIGLFTSSSAKIAAPPESNVGCKSVLYP